MKDSAGRTLKVGQIADLCLTGMFHGRIVEIHETPIMTGPSRVQIPQCVVSIVIPLTADQAGQIEGLYVIRDAPEQAKVSVQ